MKCPCEGCITFVMCKNRLFSKHKAIVMNLAHNCPFLREYMIAPDYKGYHRLDVARHVFGLNIIRSYRNEMPM